METTAQHPGDEMPVTDELSDLMLRRFRGREDTVAVQNGKGFKPQKLGAGNPMPTLIDEHLSGRRSIGLYFMAADNTVRCSAIDFDNKSKNPDPKWREKSELLYYALCKIGLKPLVEISQSGEAAHVWLFFDEPVAAWIVRQFWQDMSKRIGVKFVEIYPRQDHLSDDGIGNLMRYPLWNQSRFVDVENEWETLDATEALIDIKPISKIELRDLCGRLGIVLRQPEQPEQAASEHTASGTGEIRLPRRVEILLEEVGSNLRKRWHSDATGLNDKSRSGIVFGIACSLVHHKLPAADIVAALRFWCDKNDFPKRPAWISTTIDNAYKKVESGAKESQDARSKDTKPKRIEYQRITSRELDTATYEQKYLIDRVLVAGQPCVIAGPKKTLKTSLLLDMAVSLVVCGFFLGKLLVSRACRVLIMSGESGLATLQETARRIARAAGHELSNLDGLIFSPDLPRFGDVLHLEAFDRFITDDEIEVVFIDPAFLCMPGADAGNLFIQGEMLRSMGEVCQRRGVTLVIVHHTRKRAKGDDTYEHLDLDDIAWSGFAEWARQWVLVSRRCPYELGTGFHRLWLCTGGSAGHSALWGVDIDEGVYDGQSQRYWDVKVMGNQDVREDAKSRAEASKETQRAEKAEKEQQRILAAILKLPDKKGTAREIREYAGISGSRWAGLWSELLQGGHVTKVGTVKAGDNQSYDVFSVSNDDE